METTEKRELLIAFHHFMLIDNQIQPVEGYSEKYADKFLSTLPDEGEKPFIRCGQGTNTCNCKSLDECGYKEIYEGIAKLKH